MSKKPGHGWDRKWRERDTRDAAWPRELLELHVESHRRELRLIEAALRDLRRTPHMPARRGASRGAIDARAAGGGFDIFAICESEASDDLFGARAGG